MPMKPPPAVETGDARGTVAAMNGGIDFTLSGVPVRVLYMFFLIMFLIGSNWQDPVLIVIWMGLAFGSILLHEMGHALAYKHFGVAPSIVLHGFGGLTFGRSLPVRQDLLVSVAGPFAGLAVGLPALWIYLAVRIPNPTVHSALYMVVFINVFWSLINLAPLLPLDGGNATNALLSLAFKRDMTAVTRVLSLVTAAVGIAVGLRFQFLFLALLAGYFGFLNVQALAKGNTKGRWSPHSTVPMPSAPVASEAPAWSPAPPSTPPSTMPPSTMPPVGTDSGSADSWTTMPAAPPERQETLRSSVPARRTFAHEVDAAARSLSRGEPELAAIGAGRARRMASTPDEHVVIDHLEREIAHRLGTSP